MGEVCNARVDSGQLHSGGAEDGRPEVFFAAASWRYSAAVL
jgi:hypothetical protein